MASYNIDYQIRRYNGTDWDNLFPYTKAANVIYGNSDVGTELGNLNTGLGSVNTALTNHKNDKDNPHDVTKAQVGLGNVDNKSASTLKTEFTGEVVSGNEGFPTGDAVKRAIDTAVSAVYKPKGSSATIPALSGVDEGWVYDISVAFTTTADFIEGSGKSYPAGTNIVCIKVSNVKKWDVLTGVTDLSGYVPTSRKVNNKTLTADITLDASDIKLSGADVTIQTTLEDYDGAIADLEDSKQDNITPERGLSFGTGANANKLGHSNSIAALTTNSFKKIAYDAYGHITGSADVTQSDIDQFIVKVFTGSQTPTGAKAGDIWLYGNDPA